MPKQVLDFENYSYQIIEDTRGEKIKIGRLPHRKSIALYRKTVDGMIPDVYAYFRTEEEATKFIRWLNERVPNDARFV